MGYLGLNAPWIPHSMGYRGGCDRQSCSDLTAEIAELCAGSITLGLHLVLPAPQLRERKILGLHFGVWHSKLCRSQTNLLWSSARLTQVAVLYAGWSSAVSLVVTKLCMGHGGIGGINGARLLLKDETICPNWKKKGNSNRTLKNKKTKKLPQQRVEIETFRPVFQPVFFFFSVIICLTFKYWMLLLMALCSLSSLEAVNYCPKSLWVIVTAMVSAPANTFQHKKPCDDLSVENILSN